MNKPTVYIIDDDLSILRGLNRLVRAAGLYAESFSSAKDFLASDKHKRPGCIVLDFRMPNMSGIELQKELCNAEYHMPIIFLSGHANIPTAAQAMKVGAIDFLTKPVDKNDLMNAIHLSLEKDRENLIQKAENTLIHEKIKMLTPREHEVMTYVITGMLNKQIAGEMLISEETVKIHRRRVKKKLAIVSVAELVYLCNKVGIIPAKPKK